MYGLKDHVKPFKKRFSDLFVADSEILHSKGRRMAKLRPLFSPRSLFGTVGKFDQIQRIVNPRLQLLHRHGPMIMRVVARREYRKRLGSDILAKLKIFKISKTERLVISPVAPSRRSVLKRADRVLPSIQRISGIRIKGTIVDETASRKPHKFRMQFFQRPGNVLSHSVSSALIRIRRKQGHKVQIDLSPPSGRDPKPAREVGHRRSQLQLILLPFRRKQYFPRRVNLPVFAAQRNRHRRFRRLFPLRIACKIVNPALYIWDSFIEAGIAYAGFLALSQRRMNNIDPQIMWIFMAHRIPRFHNQPDLPAGLKLLPCG